MKRINFLTNAMIPGTLGMHRWDMEGRCIIDITLRNSFAQQNQIAEMCLNVNAFSVIDEYGKEYFIRDFEGQRSLHLYGKSTGKNIRTKSPVELEPGNYVHLRLYVEPYSNTYVRHDGVAEPFPVLNFVEFEIEDGLQITSNDQAKWLIRFDFFPLKPWLGLRRALDHMQSAFDFRRKLTRLVSSSFSR